MKKYQDCQDDSVMFDGQKAKELVTLRERMDYDTQSIQERLIKAIDTAEREMNELNERYSPKTEQIVAGTDLENVPISEIGFDFSKSQKYDIVFGHKVDNRVHRLFQSIRSLVENYGYLSTDQLSTQKSEFERWGAHEKQRETENA